MIADLTATAVTTAGGVCRIDLRSTGRQLWQWQQISTSMATAPATAVCGLFKNSTQVTPLIPTGDAADGQPPLPCGTGDVVSIIWTGATPGTIGNVYAIYDDGQGT